MNVAHWLERAAERNPGKVAAISEGTHAMTYGELDAAASRLGNALRVLGIRSGDRVSILLANSLEFLIAYFGILKLGAVVAPVNILYRAGEVKYVLNNATPRALIAGSEFLQVVWWDSAACRTIIGRWSRASWRN